MRLHEFRLVVDNTTMTCCETSADMMVQRWYLRIQHYNSEIVHQPGIMNVVPDAGSRLLHLQHPNLQDSQFHAMHSFTIPSQVCAMFFEGTACKHTARLQRRQASAAQLSQRLPPLPLACRVLPCAILSAVAGLHGRPAAVAGPIPCEHNFALLSTVMEVLFCWHDYSKVRRQDIDTFANALCAHEVTTASFPLRTGPTKGPPSYVTEKEVPCEVGLLANLDDAAAFAARPGFGLERTN